jgi:hypothetical protein
LRVLTAPAPSPEERYCAWYGAAEGGVLYVGEAAFWSSMREAGGDPEADLRRPGPRRVGRFDLARERWLEPLEVGPPDSRSGVWDVHVQDGGLYFTTFFEHAGRVDLASGRVTEFDAAGRGLNELAEGPDGTVLATRYGSGRDTRGDGELLSLDPSGRVVERFALAPPTGFRVAPKTPAWDAVRDRLWTTTDLLPLAQQAIRHDTYVLARGGAQVDRIEAPEIQFVAVGADGTFYRAEADRELWLHARPPFAPPAAARRTLLDPAFPAALDFVQDLKPTADGRVVVTRWSGTLHVVDAAGDVATARLPRLDPDGLYYSGVIHGDRLCVSYCADVTVVCVNVP